MPHIKLLVPDLPSADSLLPLLRRIDAARWYSNFGPLVNELEAQMSQHWPTPAPSINGDLPGLHVITLNTGTAPLELGIAALQLQEGSKVLLPSFTFPATASAVVRNNLQPVFSDISADTWQLTPNIARGIAKHHPLRLVMPVATFGCPLDCAAWDHFVEETGIPVLMDAAGAFGNQPIGKLTHVSFSMHATKPFGIGEGGLFVTRDPEMASRVRCLSNFGFQSGLVTRPGTNAKLSEYAAAVALAQWLRWPSQQSARRTQWITYAEQLHHLNGVQLQAGFSSSALPANVVISLACSSGPVGRILAGSGIETRRWYCPPLHLHPAFAGFAPTKSDVVRLFPVTEVLAANALGLPWHHLLSVQDFSRINRCLAQAINLELGSTGRIQTNTSQPS